MKPTAYLLVGPPGSGKSTWRAGHLAQSSRPTVVLSSDDVIDNYAAEHGINYTEAFSRVDHKDITHQLNAALDAAVARGDDIVIDRTNMTVKSRRSWIDRLPRGYRLVAVVFEVERSELDRRLTERATATGKHIPKHVVDDMLGRYEAPTLVEFHEVVS